MDEDSKAFQLWSFPPITHNEPTQMSQDAVSEEEKESSPTSCNNDKLTTTEPQVIDQQTLDLKSQLESQLSLMQDIQKQIQASLAEIDDSLLLQIVTCLKKITLKIIKKELSINPDTINRMIETTLQDISPHSDCQIYLSSDDFQHLEKEPFNNTTVHFHKDQNLNSGDFKISTSTGEIIAILEERVHQLFELPQ